MTKSIPDLIQMVDQLLPQTQCERCGYKGCLPYAQAVVRDNEAINLCYPGGQATADLIAKALKRETQTVAKPPQSMVARVIEQDCIGCTKCIQACPVDAIVGARKLMHTVIESECTGCELCIPPCPTQCIELVASEEPQYHPTQAIAQAKAEYLKARFISRTERLAKQLAQATKVYRKKTSVDIKAEIQKSLNRVKLKKQHESTEKTGDFPTF